jgi:hypothetical protein
VTAALALLGYAVAVGWFAPAVLAPLTSGGRSVRPALCVAGLALALMSAALILLPATLAAVAGGS